MGLRLGLLLAVLTALATVSAGSSCSAGSYRNAQTGQCTPCPATSYTSTQNNQPQCNRCRICSDGKFSIQFPCLATSNTICGCKPGYMCTTKNCKSCKPHLKCKKGQEVKQEGHSFRDTRCKDCESGTYSDRENGVCTPWTDCSAKGLQVVRNGSRIEDVICGSSLITPVAATNPRSPKLRTPVHPKDNKSDGIVAIIAIVLLPCIFIPFILYVMMQTRRMQNSTSKDLKKNEEFLFALTADDRCSCHCPEEEIGDWQLRQETTPKPPEWS
ncbi:tumor necrosis factor receptor superfamily member 9-like [Narcine bancroftii]|uniref:tumor necrosis factor receptor superfamily member 9-like n=1 Tax=Narcine bancroftii TaxID=1343680 RepID=UPI0038321EAE